MSKKLLVMLVILSFVLIAANPKAPGGLTYTSGVQVMNLEGTEATVTLTYYNQNGTVAGILADDTISANSSKTYFPLTGVSDGFNGSMVITSDKQVAAIANLITTDLNYGASTTGFSSGATTFNLPLLMCNNSGFNTFFNIQNAGSGDAGVTVNYIPGSNGNSGVSETATIKQGASKTFDQAVGSATKNCTLLADGSGKFIGSAQITSDKPIVATVMQLNTTNFKIMMGYNGFATGSTTVSLPLIMANNYGYYTGVQIQNTGSLTTDVTLSYATNSAGSFAPEDETFSLDGGASKTIIQSGPSPANGSLNDWSLPERSYIGAATVTNSASQPLVAIVNQVSVGKSGIGPFGTAYEGFDPTTASAAVSAPLVMSNNSGYYTGIQVQNVGSGTCSSITIDYGANVAPGGTFNPTSETFSLTDGSSKTVIQSGLSPNNGSVNNWTGVGKYIGSADISAPGCLIVAIINQIAIAGGDRFMTYDGFNH